MSDYKCCDCKEPLTPEEVEFNRKLDERDGDDYFLGEGNACCFKCMAADEEMERRSLDAAESGRALEQLRDWQAEDQ